MDKEYEEKIKQGIRSGELDFLGNPKPKEGYVREYIDHTGRFWRDLPIAASKKKWEERKASLEYKILQEEIDKQAIKDIVHKAT
jgi:hypothetical protein